MACCINENSGVGKFAIGSGYVTGILGVIAGTVCVIALLVILGNHIKASLYTKLYTNVQLLKPEVIAVFWSVAKWSGIASASLLGWTALSFGSVLAGRCRKV